MNFLQHHAIYIHEVISVNNDFIHRAFRTVFTIIANFFLVWGANLI